MRSDGRLSVADEEVCHTEAAVGSRDMQLLELGTELHRIVTDVASGNLDAGAVRVNALLESSPAYPHLAKDTAGVWHLHHHPVDTELVAMWTAICAEAIARLIGTGQADRLGICDAWTVRERSSISRRTPVADFARSPARTGPRPRRSGVAAATPAGPTS